MLSAVNVCPSNVATLPRYCSTSSGSASYALERHERHAVGQPCRARQRGVEAAVHEHQRVPVRRAEGERLELRGLHAMRRWREQVELPLGDRRDGGEVPVLVLRRREAERLEPVMADSRSAQSAPSGRPTPRCARTRAGTTRSRDRPRAASRSPSPRARARAPSRRSARSAAREHVHVVGHDVVEQPLSSASTIVALSGRLSEFTPCATMRSASMSSPESVSSSTASFGSSTAICRICSASSRPRRTRCSPSASMSGSISTSFIFSSIRSAKLIGSISSPRAFRISLYAARRKYALLLPGSPPVLEREEDPLLGADFGIEREQVLPLVRHRTFGDLVRRMSGQHLRQRALAGPFGPITACLSRVHGEVDPRRISRSPAVAWRFFISSIEIHFE